MFTVCHLRIYIYIYVYIDVYMLPNTLCLLKGS